MNDPVTSFSAIRDFYITYLETAFRIGEPAIQANRRRLLEEVGTLCTEPFIEPLPSYRDYGHTIDALAKGEPAKQWLPNFSTQERESFIALCLAGLLPASKDDPAKGRFKLYTHQLDMLVRGIGTGTPGIVTSGTGSGKTESFLLPIFAAISKEAVNWPASKGVASWSPWWRKDNAAPAFQRDEPNESAKRPKAVRALVLYPMNALVEDQMVRLRRALDSDAAHAAMDANFNGNRIYFGRYTGATEVTGWRRHPRIDNAKELKREASRIEKLRAYMQQVEETQAAVKDALAAGNDDESLPFNFPRAPGNETVSRWDMQRNPPDILITNTSMLATMLVREIDEPIFAQTRHWLETDPDAYFYLVVDELHLQRGSPGTEVGYLFRMLLSELGLTRPEHQHKLRILCSSASLPVDGDEGKQSLEYLWGLFGTAGIGTHATREQWAQAIVRGSIHPAVPEVFDGSAPELNAILSAARRVIDAADDDDTDKVRQHWEKLAGALGVDTAAGGVEQSAAIAVCVAGRLLETGCTKHADGSGRATSLDGLAAAIFGSAGCARSATENLVWLRAQADSWEKKFKKAFDAPFPVPRFRVHTFLRALGGLFVAPLPSPLDQPAEKRTALLFNGLTIESGTRYGPEGDSTRKPRNVDLLYCECCGVLFYGGRYARPEVPGAAIELLPSDPDMESLPERAKVNLVEQHSADDYCIFMPVLRRFWPCGSEELNDAEAQGKWRQAEYDTFSATVKAKIGSSDLGDGIHGWHYYVDKKNFKGEARRSQKTPADAGTALPFQCPACGVSYRNGRGKLSPLRGFRVGFAKTTQLLATTLMTELQKSNPRERLVSFSDSRQDAAKAAFDLESGHHDDVCREIVVKCLDERRKSSGTKLETEAQIEGIRARMKVIAGNEALEDESVELAISLKRLKAQLSMTEADCVPVADILEPFNPEPESPVKPVLGALVSKGIHPTDRTGIAPVPDASWQGERAFSWQQLFARTDSGWTWNHVPAYSQELSDAAREVSDGLVKLVGDTLFSRTYFAVEETGWGYPCLPLADGETREMMAPFDAMVRVLTDIGRRNPSPYSFAMSDWEIPKDAHWKLKRFAEAHCNERGGDKNELIRRFLDILAAKGHCGGIISVSKIYYRPLESSMPYWRCDNCGRVHLHLGGTVCTRCVARLPGSPSGTLDAVRAANYLGKRILQSEGIHRLRAEELTGMTSNPAARLRRFKGILINDEDDILPAGFRPVPVDEDLDREARVVDILSVTTTMEVGVDIGDLRAVFQANMPPQRFNYQQRVGRAGRRGQAFSFVLTVCRSKSHDLHYFRHPEKITGDSPPPPFLTTSLNQIAQRLILKQWLVGAFRSLRSKYPAAWPGDELRSSPDNHGEFFSTSLLLAERDLWLPRIRSALTSLVPKRDEFALLCMQGDTARAQLVAEGLTVATAMHEITKAMCDPSMSGKGLAEALAERGQLPMYGMPTRSRSLYTRAVAGARSTYTFAKMDRDLDMAIQEFAPGRLLTQDKRRYFTSGFAGSDLRRSGNPNAKKSFYSTPDDLGEMHLFKECQVCLAWSAVAEGEGDSTCKSCTSEMAGAIVYKTYVPRGFITSMEARKPDETLDEAGTRVSRSVMAEAEKIECQAWPGSNLDTGLSGQSRVLRMNKGQYTDTGWTGFSATKGSLGADCISGGKKTTVWINGVYIDDAARDADNTSYTGLREKFKPEDDRVEEFFLLAPKITDSLVLMPHTMPPSICYKAQDDSAIVLSIPFRAAALSACFMIIDYASRELLDVDPGEFQILEPRVKRNGDGSNAPFMQFSDDLVNGSGLCNRLDQPGISGEPIVLEVIRKILSLTDRSPLPELLEPKHSKNCLTGCYRCLHRYSNQNYHGLLDWRLGLTVLHLLVDSQHTAGLSGDFSTPDVADWPAMARQLADDAAGLFGGFAKKRKEAGSIPLFGIGEDKWAAVVHPLWDWDAVQDGNEVLQEMRLTGQSIVRVTTFDLARRMGHVLQELRKN